MRRALVLTTILALAAAACGDGEGEGDVAPDAWVQTICTTLTDWNGQLQARTSDLQGELQGLPQGDFQGLQDLMLTYVGGVIEDTDQAVTTLQEAGAPAVEDGQEVSELMVDGVREARTIFEDAREEIAALNPDRPRRFATSLEEIGGRVQEGGARVQGSFQAADERGLGGEELDQAFSEEPACSGLAPAPAP